MKMLVTTTVYVLTLVPWEELISFDIALLKNPRKVLLEEQRKNIVDEICTHVLFLLLIYDLNKLKGVCSNWCLYTWYNDTQHYDKLLHFCSNRIMPCFINENASNSKSCGSTYLGSLGQGTKEVEGISLFLAFSQCRIENVNTTLG
jgi:hypothetical protein